jgi:hypothetical protein
VAGQLRDDEPVVADEPRRDRPPVPGPAAQAVDEDERLPLAADEVADAAPAALLDVLQGSFGVRHLGGIFFS